MPAFGSDQNLNTKASGRFKVRHSSVAAVGGDDQHMCLVLSRRILCAFTVDSVSITEHWGHRTRQDSRDAVRTERLVVAAATAATHATATYTLKDIVKDKDLVSTLLFIADFAAPQKVQGNGVHYQLEALTL